MSTDNIITDAVRIYATQWMRGATQDKLSEAGRRLRQAMPSHAIPMLAEAVANADRGCQRSFHFVIGFTDGILNHAEITALPGMQSSRATP